MDGACTEELDLSDLVELRRLLGDGDTFRLGEPRFGEPCLDEHLSTELRLQEALLVESSLWKALFLFKLFFPLASVFSAFREFADFLDDTDLPDFSDLTDKVDFADFSVDSFSLVL